MIKRLFPFVLILTLVSCNKQAKENPISVNYSIISLLGKSLIPPAPSDLLLQKFEQAKLEFEEDPYNIENIIWYGRRTAYLGRYVEAIEIFTDGIKKYPREERLYRHRGHRYISIREFDKAIMDLEFATKLIVGKENTIEQDGMPNSQNIPVSTLHGNIYYHLGLAYYLNQDMEKAFDAYLKCRESGSLDDNIVSSTHWLYMIQRRLGNEKKANEMLEPIEEEMDIIENFNYHKLCLFYKGLLNEADLANPDNSPAGASISYALANWDLYNNKTALAKEKVLKFLDSNSWASFGYIAAESDYLDLTKTED